MYCVHGQPLVGQLLTMLFLFYFPIPPCVFIFFSMGPPWLQWIFFGKGGDFLPC